MPVQISVVIPTHNRPHGLTRLLDALSRQSLPPEGFEIIVVDDGSREAVRAEAGGLTLRVLRHEQARGPAAARNSGWRAASADVVAFIDDDCAPAEGWLEAILAATDGARVVVQGRVAPLPEHAARMSPLAHTIEVAGPSPLFVSANVAYPRSLLERLGGFDERFKRACGEDVELGARAQKAGAVTRFATEALVYHEVRELSLAEHVRHTLKWTDAVAALALHPELRGLLTLRVFWKPTHLWLLGILAGLAARRRWLAALGLGAYLRHYQRLYSGDLRAIVKALPAHVVIDTCEIGTALAGSLEHRTLML